MTIDAPLPHEGPPLSYVDEQSGDIRPTDEYHRLLRMLYEILSSESTNAYVKEDSIQNWIRRNGINPSRQPVIDLASIIVASDHPVGSERLRNARALASMRNLYRKMKSEKESMQNTTENKWMSSQLRIDKSRVSQLFSGLDKGKSVDTISMEMAKEISIKTGDSLKWIWDGLMWSTEERIPDYAHSMNENLSAVLPENRHLPEWMICALDVVLKIRSIINDSHETNTSFYGSLVIHASLADIFTNFLDFRWSYHPEHTHDDKDCYLLIPAGDIYEQSWYLYTICHELLNSKTVTIERSIFFSISELEWLQEMIGTKADTRNPEHALVPKIRSKIAAQLLYADLYDRWSESREAEDRLTDSPSSDFAGELHDSRKAESRRDELGAP
jgi:hypothetical protein